MNSGFSNIYKAVCTRNGKVIWEEEIHNLVTQEGLDHLLSNYFKGVGYTAEHYMAVKTGSAIVSVTTLADFVASYEDNSYNGDRKLIQLSVPTDGFVGGSRQVTNDATPCIFEITAGTTITGVGVCTVATGTAGILFAGAEFSAPRPLISGDVLSLVCSFSQVSL